MRRYVEGWKTRYSELASVSHAAMHRGRTTPAFQGLTPASAKASAIARSGSRKTDTRCEIALRRELWRRGLRYNLHVADLPGRPDIVFPKNRVAVFCDGDFWHGRHIDARLGRLAAGHNSAYWVAKVRRNLERDRQQSEMLEALGWVVLRFWETDILRNTVGIADSVVSTLALSKGKSCAQV